METLHLQGIGKHPAKRVKDLEIGDVIVWNYGYKSIFRGIVKETKTQIIAKLFNEESRYHERRMSKEKLVGIKVTNKL